MILPLRSKLLRSSTRNVLSAKVMLVQSVKALPGLLHQPVTLLIAIPPTCFMISFFPVASTQKKELVQLYVKCTQKDVHVNNVLARARPLT